MRDAELLRWPTTEAVIRLCLDLVVAARAAEQRLDDPAATEALHDFRVALRRLRSALRIWREPLGNAVRARELRGLRDLQRATGAGRDAEVALAWLERQPTRCAPEHASGLAWLASRWNAELTQTRDLLDAELRERFHGIAQRLEKRLQRETEANGASRFGDALAQAALACCEDLIGRLARISGAEDQAGMHAARIACKRLRYVIEPVRGGAEAAAELLETCKALQTLLGELNDAAALESALAVALAESAAMRAARVAKLVRTGYADGARREAWFTEWPGLIELALILADERAALFARLKREWLAPGAGPLRAQAQALADALRALLDGHPEIERKFLLTRLPLLEGRNATCVLIEQGWLPGTSLRERVRALNEGAVTHYFRTLKLGSGVRRTELEDEITPELHAELWPKTVGCRLRKRRHHVPEGALTFEVDEFLDRDLVLAEVELPAEDAALTLPDWLAPHVAREVTGEPEYTGSALGR